MSLPPEQSHRAEEIISAAGQLQPAERAAFIDQQCGDDPEVRDEVLIKLGLAAIETKTAVVAAQPTTDSFAGYQVVRELSRGGQGVVYQALQKGTNRKVAIKVLREGPYATPAAKKRFDREIELVAQLKHPSIISIFHSGVTAD